MAKTHTILEVFIASPGDVAQERAVLEEVVAEFNHTWGDKHEVRLELLKSETHSFPGFGKDAQDVINKQVSNEYDIFLGIMWGRFGTMTGRAESGTEEEFLRAYDRLLNGDKIKIMFYFKDAGIAPSKMDVMQITKVQAFKEKIANQYGGLYYPFETTEDFQTKARIHLSKVVQEWLDSNTGEIDSKTVIKSDAEEPSEYNPLANLSALDSLDAEEGILDLVDRGTEALDEVVQIVNRMGDATNDLGHKFTQRTLEAQSVAVLADRKAVKRVSNNAANDLDVFVRRMSVEIPEFFKQSGIFTESFGKIAMITEKDFPLEEEDLQSALANMQSYRGAIENSSSSLVQFRQSISELPRMTTTFNQARRRAVAIMDDLFAQLRIASSQAKDIENLLLRLL